MKFIYQENSRKSGIYRIFNTHNNRIYIGQTKRFKGRWSSHKSSLLNNKHNNKFLLNDFNKCKKALGHDDFLEFDILEIVNGTKEERLKREQNWIDSVWDNQIKCYNLNPKAQSCEGRKNTVKQHLAHMKSQDHRKKALTVIAPNGLEVSFTGIREFCRNVDIRFSQFCEMLNDHTPSSAGWRLPQNKDKPIGQTLPKKYDVILQDPNGVSHGPIFNLEEFCRIHLLQASAVRHMLAGRYNSTRGWKVLGQTGDKRKRGSSHPLSRSCVVDEQMFESVLQASKHLKANEASLRKALNHSGKCKGKKVSWY